MTAMRIRGRNPLKLVANVKVQVFGSVRTQAMSLRVKLDQILFFSEDRDIPPIFYLLNMEDAHQILRDETSNSVAINHNDQTFQKMLTTPFVLYIKRGVVKTMIVSRIEPDEVTEIKKLLAFNLVKKSGHVHLQRLAKTPINIHLETPRFPMQANIANDN